MAQIQPAQSPLAMQFASNGRMDENSFKISLKRPTTSTNTTTNSNSNSNSNHISNSNTVSNNQNGPATPNVPSTVTSTNPKTPSPSTNDVSIHILLLKKPRSIFITSRLFQQILAFEEFQWINWQDVRGIGQRFNGHHSQIGLEWCASITRGFTRQNDIATSA